MFPEKSERGNDLILRPHHGVLDGRFANNAWLQELPDPVSKLVWENAASMSAKTAEGLGVEEGDKVSVQVGEATVELPVLVQPGMAEGVVQTTLGHGRTRGGAVALEAGGVNTAPLLGQENADTPRLALQEGERKEFSVTATNLTDRPVRGTIQAGSVIPTLKGDPVQVELRPNESKALLLPIAAAATVDWGRKTIFIDLRFDGRRAVVTPSDAP